MSVMSLIIYTRLETPQKARNAITFLKKWSKLNSCPAKIMGAKTKKFFSHCLGLISNINFSNFNNYNSSNIIFII